MGKTLLGCTIKRMNMAPQVMTFSSKSEFVLEILYDYLMKYLDEDIYGLCLTQDRERLLRDEFTFISAEFDREPLTSEFILCIYKENEWQCEMKLPTYEDYVIANSIIKLCGKKYLTKRKR